MAFYRQFSSLLKQIATENVCNYDILARIVNVIKYMYELIYIPILVNKNMV